jgi:hypothetical protein
MDTLGEQYAEGLQEMVLRIRKKVKAEQGDDADFGIVWYAEHPNQSERHCLLTPILSTGNQEVSSLSAPSPRRRSPRPIASIRLLRRMDV